jgi:hypothetical protein
MARKLPDARTVIRRFLAGQSLTSLLSWMWRDYAIGDMYGRMYIEQCIRRALNRPAKPAQRSSRKKGHR